MVQPVWWAACGGTDFTPVRHGATTIVTERASFSVMQSSLSASELVVIANYRYCQNSFNIMIGMRCLFF